MLWISFYFGAQLFLEISASLSGLPDQVTDFGEERCSLWPGGAVIYTIDSNIGCPNTAACRVIMDAITHYEKRTCIRFQYRSGERDYVKISYDPNRGDCEAHVGRFGGEQTLVLGTECWAPTDIMHEFGHSVGLPDEISRPDRDDYIRIDFDAVKEEYFSSFDIHDPKFPSVLEEPFDYLSIMMYDPFVATKGEAQTVFSKTSQPIVPILTKSGLSYGDVKKITRLYGCEGNYQDTSFPFDINCTFDDDDCGFTNLEDAEWRRTDKVGSNEQRRKGYIYVDFDNIGYQPARFASVNFHGLSPRDKVRGPKGCLTFSYKISLPFGLATLDVSQIGLSSPHQLFYRSPPSSLWSESNATKLWTRVSIPVTVKKPFALVFRANFRQPTTGGNIAVDDLLLSYDPCKSSLSSSPRSRGWKSFGNSLSKSKF